MRQRSGQRKLFRAADPFRVERHEPFALLLRRVRAQSLRWHRAHAGLAVLELLDQLWSTRRRPAPVSALRHEEVDRAVRAVRPAAARQILATLVDLAAPGPHPKLDVLTALRRYGLRLEAEREVRLATHVYRIVIDRALDEEFFALAARTYERVGACLWDTGDRQRAMDYYRVGTSLAERSNDEETALRLWIERASLHRACNDVVEAAAIADAVLVRARALGAPKLTTRAAREHGAVAQARGHHLDALGDFAEAVRTCADAWTCSGVLNDIARSLAEIGLAEDARAVWQVVFQDCRANKFERWAAGIKLLQCAHERGNAVVFDQYHRDLEPAPMTGPLLVQFWLEVGDGLRTFGRPQQVGAAYRRAATYAKRYGLTAEYARAEQALQGAPVEVRQVPAPPSTLPEHVVQLLEMVRARRSPHGATAAGPRVLRTTLRRGRPRNPDA
jgi:hypothetical protein